MKTCGLNTIKYLFFSFNLLFLVSGLGILVAGATVVNEVKDYSHFMTTTDVAMPVIFIITGLSIFFVAFLGCCGGLKENYNMLIAFGVFLTIIFVIELAVGIAAGISKDDFPEALRNTMEDAMKTYDTNVHDKVSWDAVQRKLECCALDGSVEWQSIAGQSVPNSCLVPDTKSRYFASGCYTKVTDIIKDGIGIINGVGIGVSLFKVTGLIITFLLAFNIRTTIE